jgi:hypothetical protein
LTHGNIISSEEEKKVKIKGVDIALDDDLIVRVMNSDYIFKF